MFHRGTDHCGRDADEQREDEDARIARDSRKEAITLHNKVIGTLQRKVYPAVEEYAVFGTAYSLMYGVILSSLVGPMPDTFSRSSIVWKGPFVVR